VLYYQPRAASADLPFPVRATHLDLTADAAPRTTPVDLPAGWENPSIDAAVPTAVVSVCAKGDAPPDIDQLRGMVDTYMHNPVVAALHAASPPTTSGARRVVTLSLPPAIGGARPFDADQIHAIAGAVRSRLGERLPIYKPDSLTDEGYPLGPPCITRFPDFATSYQAAMALTERVRNDMDSLDALAP
ncbi:MAG TPA: hypothetical protein VME40_03785, partial [Caulobacteraceae bacterium]|nr:hypothetical protein [Caulobacteraceae bacterium]